MDIFTQIKSWLWLIIASGITIGGFVIGAIGILLLPLYIFMPVALVVNIGELFWKER